MAGTKRFLTASSRDGDREAEARALLERGEHRPALSMLIRDYGPALYRYCCGVLGDRILAEDVYQTTFTEAYRDLGKFRGSSSLRAWLYGIARHRCLDAIKRRRRFAKHIDLPGELESNPDPIPDARTRLADRERRDALEYCLAQLPAATRMAVLLRYQEGFSYPEIATICRARPATLQARVARALPLLRRCLEAWEKRH